MKLVSSLTVSQLAQRVDELQEVLDMLAAADRMAHYGIVKDRLEEVQKELAKKVEANTFNRQVVTPLPPEKVDTDNPHVVTPKAPAQYDRELEAWERGLEQ